MLSWLPCRLLIVGFFPNLALLVKFSLASSRVCPFSAFLLGPLLLVPNILESHYLAVFGKNYEVNSAVYF